MAEREKVQWLDGKANVSYAVEKICPGTHISQHHWQMEWDEMFRGRCSCDYMSDYECIFNHPIDVDVKEHEGWENLQAAKPQRTKVPITYLAHFTSENVAEAIVTTGGFIGEVKKINEDVEGYDEEAKVSWWSPKFGEDAVTLVRDTLREAIQPLLAPLYDQSDNQDVRVGGNQDGVIQPLQNQFATSDAFSPNDWRYGRVYFQYDINDLCDYYNIRLGGEVQFKILGTYLYKKEVMHGVLVCNPENGDELFAGYPFVLTPQEDVNYEAVVTLDNNGKWIWKPQSTGTEIERLPDQSIYPKYRRWVHVAFAFHIPDERRPRKRGFHVCSRPR